MSSKWVGKMHRALPLNWQEKKLDILLDSMQIPHTMHEVFPLVGKTLVVDSFIPHLNVLIECWMSESRRSAALTWLERNAAFVDLKFVKLKRLNSGFRCLGYVEAPQADPASLRLAVSPVMEHADFMAFSPEEVESILLELRGAQY